MHSLRCSCTWNKNNTQRTLSHISRWGATHLKVRCVNIRSCQVLLAWLRTTHMVTMRPSVLKWRGSIANPASQAWHLSSRSGLLWERNSEKESIQSHTAIKTDSAEWNRADVSLVTVALLPLAYIRIINVSGYWLLPPCFHLPEMIEMWKGFSHTLLLSSCLFIHRIDTPRFFFIRTRCNIYIILSCVLLNSTLCSLSQVSCGILFSSPTVPA